MRRTSAHGSSTELQDDNVEFDGCMGVGRGATQFRSSCDICSDKPTRVLEKQNTHVLSRSRAPGLKGQIFCVLCWLEDMAVGRAHPENSSRYVGSVGWHCGDAWRGCSMAKTK